MKELVEVIAKALVDNPEGVVVTEKEDGKNVFMSHRRTWGKSSANREESRKQSVPW